MTAQPRVCRRHGCRGGKIPSPLGTGEQSECHGCKGTGLDRRPTPDLCEYCGTRPAAFRVKHPETSRHWRCLGCFRALARSMVVIVSGVRTPTRSLTTHDLEHLDEARALRLAATGNPDYAQGPKP